MAQKIILYDKRYEYPDIHKSQTAAARFMGIGFDNFKRLLRGEYEDFPIKRNREGRRYCNYKKWTIYFDPEEINTEEKNKFV